MTHRENAQHEAALDLTKTPLALLSDVHDESNKGDAVHANKRIAGLNAVLSARQIESAERLLGASNDSLKVLGEMKSLVQTIKEESDRTQKRLDRLNRWMLRLTVAGVLFAAGSFWLAWKSLQIQEREQEKKEKPALSQLATDTTNPTTAPVVPVQQAADIAPTIPRPVTSQPSPEIPPAAPAPQARE